MSIKNGDVVYFVKRKYEDLFFKNGETSVYICNSKEMILKGTITDIKDDTVSIKVSSNKNNETKEKDTKIKITDLVSKKTNIPAKLLGVWS